MAFTPLKGTGVEMGEIPLSADDEITYEPTGYGCAAVASTEQARTGIYSMKLTGNEGPLSGEEEVRVNFNVPGTPAEVYISAWCYQEYSAGYTKIEAVLSTGETVGIWRHTSTWDAYVDGALVDSGSIAVSTGVWTHVQVRISIADSGVIQTKINGVDDIDYSGDTQPGATAEIIAIRFAQQGGRGVNYTEPCHIDDFCWGTGGWPGAIRFNVLLLAGDDSVEWTPSSGDDNYAMVDERPPSTGDYVSVSDDGMTDKYTIGNWSGTAKSAQFVTAWAYGKKDKESSSIQLHLLVDSNSTEGVSDATDLPTTEAYCSYVATQDPDTLAPWTGNAIDAIKIGIRSA